jgi:hypothetical protein
MRTPALALFAIAVSGTLGCSSSDAPTAPNVVPPAALTADVATAAGGTLHIPFPFGPGTSEFSLVKDSRGCTALFTTADAFPPNDFNLVQPGNWMFTHQMESGAAITVTLGPGEPVYTGTGTVRILVHNTFGGGPDDKASFWGQMEVMGRVSYNGDERIGMCHAHWLPTGELNVDVSLR